MTPLTTVKLMMALVAAILFAIGIRTDQPALRWAAIGFLTVAVLLRFVDRGRRPK